MFELRFTDIEALAQYLLQLSLLNESLEPSSGCPTRTLTFLCSSGQVGDYFMAYPHDVLLIFDEVLRQAGSEASQTASAGRDGAVGAPRSKMRHTLHSRITGRGSFLLTC